MNTNQVIPPWLHDTHEYSHMLMAICDVFLENKEADSETLDKLILAVIGDSNDKYKDWLLAAQHTHNIEVKGLKDVYDLCFEELKLIRNVVRSINTTETPITGDTTNENVIYH